MKPREFDELIRQKFDQNDFEYSPKSWDRLVDELDGRAKKRGLMAWWWIPLTGIAASVALAMGVPGLLKHTEPSASIARVQATTVEHNYASLQSAPARAADEAAPVVDAPVATRKKTVKHTRTVNAENNNNTADNNAALAVNVATAHAAGGDNVMPGRTVNLLSIGNIPSKNKEAKKPIVIAAAGFNTFKPEVMGEEKPTPKMSVILSGGLNRGSQANGYMAGATIRRMINEKVFVEGDVAFANSSNSASKLVRDNTPAPGAYGKHSAAKTASPDAAKIDDGSVAPTYKTENVGYSLSYAQVTPCLGYKLMKRMSIAGGPDFQQVLADNRPAPSTEARTSTQVAALFDVGVIGKTEYTVTKNIKAGVSYRKGINTIITPTEKYFDRDYLQFQLKCAIFNK